MAKDSSSKNVRAGTVGSKYIYTHPLNAGFGEHHKSQAGFGEITAEMSELDLKDGTEVTLVAHDEDSGWPIVNWTDAVGIDRHTTIDQATFDEFFVPND
jgi:hypothetical protein